MSEPTLYDKIIANELPSFKVWEDDNYVAFLTPWPNTPGFTVVTAKQNPGDNYIAVSDEAFSGLLLAAKKVAAGLQKAFNAPRVGLVIEGEGVPHLHVKLIPMIPADDGSYTHANRSEFFEHYPGYLSTTAGPRMSDEDLAAVQAKIVGALK